MSIERYRNDNPRTATEIADAIEFELHQIDESYPVIVGTQNYAYINSFANTLATQQEESLNELYDAGFITDATGVELTKQAREVGVDRQDAVAATGVVKFTRDTAASQDRTAPSGTRVTTGGNDGVVFETTELATIDGAYTTDDTTQYSTTSTSYVTKTTFTVDADYRDSVDASVDLQTSNSSYTASCRVRDVTNSTTIDTFTTTNTSLTAFGPTTYDISSISGDINIEFQVKSGDSSATATIDNATVDVSGQYAALANVMCTETGPVGNVGAGTVTALIDKPAGISDVTNPNPMGDPSYTLTDDSTALTVGAVQETDPELRERALESTAIGGAGTAEAVELALENIDNVISADVFSNRSTTTTNNVDPWHTEVRVYGGEIDIIAERLYETLPLATLKSLQGGANGTKATTTFTGSDLYGDLTIPITRPTEVTLSIDIDVVHTASYEGTAAAKDVIVRYIGGTTTDARTIAGLGQGENVLVNEVENVVEDLTGAAFADVTLLDSNGDNTDDTTTDSDGVPVYEVSDSEVATVDASDITVTETSR